MTNRSEFLRKADHPTPPAALVARRQREEANARFLAHALEVHGLDFSGYPQPVARTRSAHHEHHVEGAFHAETDHGLIAGPV